MAAAAQNINNTTIRSILLGEKLTGSNFTNWYCNLRIFLRYEKKLKFVEQPIGPEPDLETTNLDTIDKYYEIVNLEQEVACIMLSSMSPDLQRTLEKYNAYDMMQELKTMFEEQAKQELFETVKAFHACYEMPDELGTIAELHAMLKVHVKGILKKAETLVALAIREGKIQKDKKKPRGAKGKDKGKTKLVYTPKPNISPSPKRDNPAKDSICHHCNEVGYETHICNMSQGLRESRKLRHGALSLYIGNGMRAEVEAIRSFDLILPNKLQRDGILQPTHDESLDKCKSCKSGKIASKPFPHQVERADLLGLIHTDICGPFRTVSREGASYFITFTDDFNRYGYVYLMKHKHEVVSERRNRTLLDMVRSMMNLTTLPKSFWGYALESTARILNMVPTKKVERTLLGSVPEPFSILVLRILGSIFTLVYAVKLKRIVSLLEGLQGGKKIILCQKE
ncbi:retrotransposon protein, putative, ty1-copia subclass [Tanacetum coccineum]